MASQTDICNRAITKLGAARITSITENSKPARVMNALWDTVRKSTLRSAIWTFAAARTTLPEYGTKPAWGYGQQFVLPPDFLRLLQVNDAQVVPSMTDYRDQDDSAYQIEGNMILTIYQAPLKIRYIRDITDTGLFDALFDEALAVRLAHEACEEISQSAGKKDALKAEFKETMNLAIRTGAVERAPQGIVDDSWMLIRL